jgi:hypothetical protein
VQNQQVLISLLLSLLQQLTFAYHLKSPIPFPKIE